MKRSIRVVTWTSLALVLCVPRCRAKIFASSPASSSETSVLAEAPISRRQVTAIPGKSDTTPPQQEKRILGIVPNFRSVSTDTMLPPETTQDKFKTGLEGSFDYSSFIFAGLQAGLSQASDSYPAFHYGAKGYGRYYWHTFVDQTDENLLVESILPTVLYEDGRYYVLGHGGFLKRTGYALSRVLITRDGKASMPLRRRLWSRGRHQFHLLSRTLPHLDQDGAALAYECVAGQHDIRSQGVLA